MMVVKKGNYTIKVSSFTGNKVEKYKQKIVMNKDDYSRIANLIMEEREGFKNRKFYLPEYKEYMSWCENNRSYVETQKEFNNKLREKSDEEVFLYSNFMRCNAFKCRGGFEADLSVMNMKFLWNIGAFKGLEINENIKTKVFILE